MPYAWVTFTTAISDLALRLDDTGNQQWTSAEMGSYIVEAIRTMNALASQFRNEMSFTVGAASRWYDITQQGGSVRPFTVTDQSQHQLIEYHLLEPLVTYPAGWTGSTQFSIADIIGNWNRRQNEVLRNAQPYMTQSLQSAPQTQRTTVADTVQSIRRVTWFPTAGTPFILFQGDIAQKNYFDSQWTVAAQDTPRLWMQSEEPPLAFDVDRVPNTTGNYELITVQSAPASTGSATVLLNVPDDWAWVVKWGTLSDLLGKDYRAADPIRQRYCEQRYQEGQILLAMAPSVLDAQIGGVPVLPDTVLNADKFNTQWEGAAPGTPVSLYTYGLNLIAVAPIPSGNFTVQLRVVANATVPVAGGDFLQVSRGDYDSILDYAEHLAKFKQGGQDFLESIPLLQRFLKQCALYNSKLNQMGTFSRPTYEIAQVRPDEYSKPDLPDIVREGGQGNG